MRKIRAYVYKNKIHCFIIVISLLIGCNRATNKLSLSKIKSERIAVDKDILSKGYIDSIMAPFRTHVNQKMNHVLCYSPKTYTKKDGALNTTAGNLMADIVFEQTAPIFKKRTGKTLDFVLLNYGGIRSTIPKGEITIRTVYQLMPFENSIVVVGLTYEIIQKLLLFLASKETAHPISKLQIVLDKNGKIHKVQVQNKSLEPNKIYYVAASDYLVKGGDHMNFFASHIEKYEMNYKIRNALIDYLEKKDTLDVYVDRRFIKLP